MKEMLDFIYWRSDIYRLHCSNSGKLCYGAIVMANHYDNKYGKLVQLASKLPSMLYALIRETLEMFTQFSNHT